MLLGEGVCERRESVSARLGACGGREGGRPASATHSFMTSISRRLLGEHMVSSRFRFRFSSRFACFVGRGASRRADGVLGGHGPPQRPKNGRAELPGSRSLGPAGRSRGYVYPAGPRASLCCCLVSVKEDLVFFWGGGAFPNQSLGCSLGIGFIPPCVFVPPCFLHDHYADVARIRGLFLSKELSFLGRFAPKITEIRQVITELHPVE